MAIGECFLLMGWMDERMGGWVDEQLTNLGL